MRNLYFLVPGTGKKFACGGLFAELKTFELARKVCTSEIVTYRQKETDTLFLDDVLKQSNLDDVIFVISWGFDVPKLAQKLKSYNVIYHAHSAGYGFKLPSSIPIITVSRNTMGYWGQKSPNSLVYYLPNEISDEFNNLNLDRDIDVLVQQRKSSDYLLKQLIPALQSQCNVVVINHFVDDLSKLFNRSKVYLYDSAEYWAQQRVSEGFGLQPMEALACGCQVFSSLNGGLSDYLDPGFNCYKIAGYSTDYDVKRILKVINSSKKLSLLPHILAEYRSTNIIKRLEIILEEINFFFDHKLHLKGDIQDLTKLKMFKLFLRKVRKKLFST
ncbi:putative Glycosyl transferase, group 1 [Crocosphaera subtropica ATCC 51142]|uniref:Glycosyl transferase, group 1 n=1 Tax=Crocosphaera subtropica (strain ATCC 51142 / BH68) TaxID=43989 RepID=B1WRP4_CROS5|nr:glycosyltransferase [Crocosphaera subtropica]ACB53485.1 putative Glycosyl transferase, group 1 [Crocosphaera subtropica ATCC 51142]